MKSDIEILVRTHPEFIHEIWVVKEFERKLNKKEDIRLMSQYPMKSGWILLLQNRIGVNTIGNKRYARKVYYNRCTKMVGDAPQNCDCHFRTVRLKNNQKPTGWIEL